MPKINKRPLLFVAVLITVTLIIYELSLTTGRDLGPVVSTCKTHHDAYEVVEKSIKGKKYKLLVADTTAKSEYGLMNVKSKKDICGYDGMMFMFEKAGIQTFWNQNTLVDLDLHWMVGDRVIREDKLVNITDNGIKIYSSLIPVNTVIEIIR